MKWNLNSIYYSVIRETNLCRNVNIHVVVRVHLESDAERERRNWIEINVGDAQFINSRQVGLIPRKMLKYTDVVGGETFILLPPDILKEERSVGSF